MTIACVRSHSPTTGRNVPRGRGPCKSWEDAADDALVNCHPFLARRKDWSLGGTLVALEA